MPALHLPSSSFPTLFIATQVSGGGGAAAVLFLTLCHVTFRDTLSASLLWQQDVVQNPPELQFTVWTAKTTRKGLDPSCFSADGTDHLKPPS